LVAGKRSVLRRFVNFKYRLSIIIKNFFILYSLAIIGCIVRRLIYIVAFTPAQNIVKYLLRIRFSYYKFLNIYTLLLHNNRIVFSQQNIYRHALLFKAHMIDNQ